MHTCSAIPTTAQHKPQKWKIHSNASMKRLSVRSTGRNSETDAAPTELCISASLNSPEKALPPRRMLLQSNSR